MINPIQPFRTDALTRLIAFDSEGRAIWPAEDLRTLLRQEIAAHLRTQGHSGKDPQVLHAMSGCMPCEVESFYDLLHHRRPPIELLRLTKEFAKQSYRNPESSLPPEICLVLYYGSIVAALTRHNQRITRLSDSDLRDGVNWIVRQPWLDEETRRLFGEGLDHLRTGRHLWRR